ncbi:hypothetical protein [Tepidiforma sp.]|uniref:hypothetical protein n=1 Tax=Tepidiforma sp. TaxID=2682230 RepID=UPI002ADE80F6|nr:hypothetical protein [Tepidiforma sp.]
MTALPPFTIARYGVYLALAVAVLTTWLATRAGHPFDEALMRAIFTFVLVTAVAFGAEAIILTSPPRTQPTQDPDPEDHPTDASGTADD